MKLEGLQIDAISDTHTKHSQLELIGGDILVHAGDISWRGKFEEIMHFLNWFEKQPYKYKILIPGNHDIGMENDFQFYLDECKNRNIILLNDSGVEIEGIKIWGSPIQPWFNDWSFNRTRGVDIQKHWDLIPKDTELLITHGPPYGILDETNNGDPVGCSNLLHTVLQTQIKCHIFGHIHEHRGYEYTHDRLFVNASNMDGRYKTLVENPFNIVKTLDGEYLIDIRRQS